MPPAVLWSIVFAIFLAGMWARVASLDLPRI
jgi:hypothetical protein